MDQQETNTKPVPTIWEIPDDVWPMIQTIWTDGTPPQTQGASARGPAAGA